MELKKQIIKRIEKRGKEFSQITLDDDYIVKDAKPDVIKIIYSQGNVCVEEKRISSGAIWVNGRMDFMVLYRSDDEMNKTEIINGSVPFQEKINVEGILEIDQPQLFLELEDLSVGVINSRKLAIRAVINVQAAIEEEKEDEYISEIEGEADCLQKQEERDMLSLIATQKDIVRIKKEIVLSNSKANIRRIIWHSIDVRNIDQSIVQNKLQLQGELYPSILYQTEEGQLEWIDTMLSFSGELDISDAGQVDVFWVRPVVAAAEIEPKNDSDGECRKFALDMTIEVYYKLWEEKKLRILEDAYALNTELLPIKERTLMSCFRMKNTAKIRVAETFSLEENQEKILQICAYKGNVRIDRTTISDQGIVFEGVLQVHILYMTAEDNFPLAHIEEVLPFEQLVEIEHMSQNLWYEYAPSVDQLQVNLLDHSEYEIKAILRIAVIAFEEENIEKISEIEKHEENMESLMERPGFVGFVVGNEELWDIAKAYHTTVGDIMETNELKSRKVKPGTKLVIVKSIATC